jgi:hypothetical protein
MNFHFKTAGCPEDLSLVCLVIQELYNQCFTLTSIILWNHVLLSEMYLVLGRNLNVHIMSTLSHRNLGCQELQLEFKLSPKG